MNKQEYDAGFETGKNRQQLQQGASKDMQAGYLAGMSAGKGGTATSPVTAFQSNKKFYHALNSNRLIQSDGLMFQFSPYLHAGGIWMGTFATDNPAEIKAIEALPGFGTPKCAVSSLTEEEYTECQKKKLATSQSLGQSLIHSEAQSQSRLSASPAEALNTEPNPPPAPEPPIAGADSLELGESKMPGEPASASPE
jgi:hypothetical protein